MAVIVPNLTDAVALKVYLASIFQDIKIDMEGMQSLFHQTLSKHSLCLFAQCVHKFFLSFACAVKNRYTNQEYTWDAFRR